MSTRGLVEIYDTEVPDEPLVTIYRQSDCYPSGLGVELGGYLKDFKIVNGYSPGEKARIANGVGCLAAQLIKWMKGDGPGNVYIQFNKDAKGYADTWCEYLYRIYAKRGVPAYESEDKKEVPSEILLEVYVLHHDGEPTLLYKGTPTEVIVLAQKD